MIRRADPAPVLVVATAARALAQSARKGGISVVALDRFADRDTREAARVCRAVPATERGFEAAALLRAAEALCPPARSRGLVYGSGLEHCPELLHALSERRRLYGNSPQTVARLKDPLAFFGLLRGLDIPYPETSLARPADQTGWLVKQVGGSGGGHVQRIARARPAARRFYYQREWPGRSVSVLFLANGARCRVLGFSETWTTSQDPSEPYRYAGGVSDADVSAPLRERLSAAAQALTAALGLKGVNGLDAIVREDEFVVLEVNPRPGATFELYEPKYAESFFVLHLRACSGDLPAVTRASPLAYAHAVVYAPRALVVAESTAWPPGCSDLPMPGTPIRANAPLCMVHACGRTAAQAQHRVLERHASVTAQFARGIANATAAASFA